MSAMHPPAPDAPCRIDGEPARFGDASVELADPALLHGLGLFETLAVHAGRPLDLEAHLERLAAAARRLGLPWPGAGPLRDEVLAQAAAQRADPGWLKIVLTGGGRRFVFGGAADPVAEGRPASAVILPWRLERRGPLTGLKTTSYAAHLIGARWAEARGADEGLWLNDRGHLAEGCRSSLFLVVRGAVLTASPSDGVLPGVVRAVVLEVCRERGLRVHEGKLRLERLRRASEAFLSSSVRGLRPLVAVDGRPVGDGRPGTLTAMLATAVRERRLRAAGPAPAGT